MCVCVCVPELLVESVPILDDFRLVLVPFGKFRDVDGDWFGDRQNVVAESGSFDLSPPRKKVRGSSS